MAPGYKWWWNSVGALEGKVWEFFQKEQKQEIKQEKWKKKYNFPDWKGLPKHLENGWKYTEKLPCEISKHCFHGEKNKNRLHKKDNK